MPFFEVMEPPMIKDHKNPRVKGNISKHESIIELFANIQREGFQVLNKNRGEKIKVSQSSKV